jgi:hypothetical protein
MSGGRSTVDQLKLDLELEGYELGTPQFEVMLRQRQVETCVEMKELPSCETCPAYFDCEIIKAHLRDLRYGVEISDGPDGGAGTADRGGSGTRG